MSKKPAAKRKSSSSSKQQQQTARKFYVFTALTGALTMTGALLLAISPQPLRPDVSLSAVQDGGSLAPIYSTANPVQMGRWKYIYVHHSRSLTASATTTDHFVVSEEGIRPTGLWAEQEPASSPTGSGTVDPGCVSVCVVGDFDRSLPTPTQQQHLARLVDSLQSNLRMSTRCLIMLDQANSPAGVGRHFPTSEFAGHLLR